MAALGRLSQCGTLFFRNTTFIGSQSRGFHVTAILEKPKSKNVLVLLRSMSGSGCSIVKKRGRTDDKVVAILYDKRVGKHCVFREERRIKSLK
ncbi:large ribosomal subunit protein bL33m-like [Branchiostoma floridae x Branchiostoma japonicum]